MGQLEGNSGAVTMSAEQGREILSRVRIAMSNATLVSIAPAKIRPMLGQPRTYFNNERVQRLADSIMTAGQIYPGIIRAVVKDKAGAEYELLDGERRWRAVILAGTAAYRAMLIEIDDEAAPYVVSVIANFNRESHTTLELVDSIIKMHEGLGLPMKEIAEVIGIHMTLVSSFYGLRRLVPAVRDMLDPTVVVGSKLLPVTAALEISRLPSKHQFEMAKRVMDRKVGIHSLRSEIIKFSKARGIPVREKSVDLYELRRSIEKRTETLGMMIERLQALLDHPGAALAVKEYDLATLRKLNGILVEGGKSILACHEVLSAAEQEKKPTLVVSASASK